MCFLRPRKPFPATSSPAVGDPPGGRDLRHVHGGCGYTDESPVERIARDVRVCQIYEGANDIQRLVIGRAVAA